MQQMMIIAVSAVTDKYTDTQTDYYNPAAHARRGLKTYSPYGILYAVGRSKEETVFVCKLIPRKSFM